MSMSDTRFYFVILVILVVVAIFGGAILIEVGMDKTSATQVMVTILGFSTLITSQIRTATVVAGEVKVSNAVVAEQVKLQAEHVNTNVEDVKKAVETSGKAITDEVKSQTAEVKEAVVGSNDDITRIKTTLNKTHALVNGAHGETLNNLASALETVAKMTGKFDDLQVAVNARKAADEHQARLTGVA